MDWLGSHWQDALVTAVTLAAAAWLWRWRRARKARGPGCAGCPSDAAPKGPEEKFVPLSSLRPRP